MAVAASLRNRITASIALIAVIPISMRLIYAWNYPGADDAFIYLTIIKNVISGNGWGILPGVPVNLATSPLFAAMGIAIGWITPHILIGGMVLSFAATAAGVYVAHLLAVRLTVDRTLQIMVTAASALNVNLWRWTGTFMETSLAWMSAVILVFWYYSIVLKAERRLLLDSLLLGAGIGVATLLRPELGMFAGIFFLHDLLNDRRDLFRRQVVTASGLAIALAPYVLWSTRIFGSPIPTTLGAKSGTHLPAFAPKVAEDIFTVISTSAPGVMLIGAVTLYLVLMAGQGNRLLKDLVRYAVFFLVPLVGLVFYFVIFETMQSPARYFLPFTATLPMLLVPIRDELVSLRMPPRWSMNRVLSLSIALQALVAIGLFHTVQAPVMRRMWSDYVATMTEAAVRADALCDPGDELLVFWDIGVISNHLRKCRLIDAGALANPELKGMSIEQMIDMKKPRFILETLGTADNHVARRVEAHHLRAVWSQDFRSHGISSAGDVFTARIFEVQQ